MLLFLVLNVVLCAEASATGITMVQDQLVNCLRPDEASRCKCSKDSLHYVCRTAGFTEIPQTLPVTISKL
nr:unnamed protein product [Callosobruchus chinensis]